MDMSVTANNLEGWIRPGSWVGQKLITIASLVHFVSMQWSAIVSLKIVPL